MRQLVILIRLGGVLAALLSIAVDVADILGLMPYSDAMPSIGRRVLHSIPTVVAAIVLLIPYRYLVGRRWFRALAFALVLMVAAATALALWGAYGYVIGKKSWHIIPAVGLFVLIPAANLWALWQIRQTSQPAV
jgi:hypothetical protein